MLVFLTLKLFGLVGEVQSCFCEKEKDKYIFHLRMYAALCTVHAKNRNIFLKE